MGLLNNKETIMRFLRSIKTLFMYKVDMYKQRNYFITTSPVPEDWSDDDEKIGINYMSEIKGLLKEFTNIYAVS